MNLVLNFFFDFFLCKDYLDTFWIYLSWLTGIPELSKHQHAQRTGPVQASRPGPTCADTVPSVGPENIYDNQDADKSGESLVCGCPRLDPGPCSHIQVIGGHVLDILFNINKIFVILLDFYFTFIFKFDFYFTFIFKSLIFSLLHLYLKV